MFVVVAKFVYSQCELVLLGAQIYKFVEMKISVDSFEHFTFFSPFFFHFHPHEIVQVN